MRVTVLISGNGSNLQALIDARLAGRLTVDLCRVISNRPDARGLERARRAGIPTRVIDHTDYPDRQSFDRDLAAVIAEDSPDLVVLAGFMRIIGPEALRVIGGNMINLHPSLLPLYRGTQTYRRALASGDSEHGASIHFVTEELDGGPVLAQVRIPILAGDDETRLAERLAPMEHRLVVAAVEFLAVHKVKCRNEEIQVEGNRLAEPLLLREDGSLL